MNGVPDPLPVARSRPTAGGIPVDQAASVRAARNYWDGAADDYQADHGADLGDADLLWGPEGLRESEAGLLGDVRDRTLLEIGCGAAHGARWVAAAGGRVLGIDVSFRQLQHARRIDQAHGVATPVAQADAAALPVASGSVDTVFSAFGALPFLTEPERCLDEVARVLRPGGRFVLSTSHPVRWMLLDDPGPEGLRIVRSYFDASPYVELTHGRVAYVQSHRTIGDWVRAVRAAGLVLDDLVEPEWEPGRTVVWGGWSPLRGALVPGTLILVGHRPRLPAEPTRG